MRSEALTAAIVLSEEAMLAYTDDDLGVAEELRQRADRAVLALCRLDFIRFSAWALTILFPAERS